MGPAASRLCQVSGAPWKSEGTVRRELPELRRAPRGHGEALKSRAVISGNASGFCRSSVSALSSNFFSAGRGRSSSMIACHSASANSGKRFGMSRINLSRSGAGRARMASPISCAVLIAQGYKGHRNFAKDLAKGMRTQHRSAAASVPADERANSSRLVATEDRRSIAPRPASARATLQFARCFCVPRARRPQPSRGSLAILA